jgi:putative DNA primase/helicase
LTAFVYRDRDGVIRFRKVRNAPGREPRFWLQKWNGVGWERGTKGVDTTILYRADEVAQAIKDEREIACVEGEKDVDRLWSLGIPATCNAHGASEAGKAPKWTKAHSEHLRGAPIVVFNDNDGAGYSHADTTCNLSLGVVKRVRRLDLASHWPLIGKGDDVSDWLDRGGGSAEALRALIAGAPDYTPRAGDGEAHCPPVSGGPADAEIARLAALSSLAYEQARKMAAEKLNVRATALDRFVKAARGQSGPGPGGGAKQGHALDLPEPEPWPEPVDGTRLLDDITAEITRYVVMAEHAASASALWCVHTYLLDHLLISPRLAIRSPVMRCGKTTLLDVIAGLTLRALPSANVTPAAVFRVVEACRPTLLIDEADTFLPGNEELRGVVNSGHRKGGKVIRTVGDDHEPRTFSTYSAVAIALIGKLPATLHDRSAPVVDLKRRLRSEKVESFRLDRVAALDDLASKSARWAFDNAARVQGVDPKLADGLFNRDADNWRPLLAIAEAAGGQWPERARKAAALCCEIDEDDVSQIEALLADIRDAFDEKTRDEVTSAEEITSAALVGRLVEMEGRPWAEIGKSRKPLTQNRLARLLKPLGIAPVYVGPEDKRSRGYRRERFKDAFDRYLSDKNDFQTVHLHISQQKQGVPSNSKLLSEDAMNSYDVPVSHCNADNLRTPRALASSARTWAVA